MPTDKEQLFLDAKEAYYKGEPIMTDSEFDALEVELNRKKSPVTKIVGYESGNSLKYKHPSKMLSLEKIKFDEEKFDEKLKSFLDKVKTPCIQTSPKLDGNAVNLIYEDGRYITAFTRGDGQFGVNVTEKVRRSVPSKIDIMEKTEIRGEMLIDIPVFDEKFKDEFKNPRNFVAGVLNKDNNSITTLNNLTFIPVDIRIHMEDGKLLYSFLEHEEVSNEKYENDNEYLEDSGFTKMPLVNEYILDNNKGFKEFKKDLENVCKIRENYEEHSFKYLVDGVVIKFIDSEDKVKLGENSHSPNWALAVKLPAVEKSTIIKEIEWNVGTTGELTPIALLESVEIDGSVISRVTMHNYGWMCERKCFPGAVVKIIKSGDIIPKITEVLKTSDFLDINMTCPECEKQLIVDGIRLKCVNDDCKAKVVKRLKNSFNALKMDYFGDSTCGLLYDAGIKNILDFLNPEFSANELKKTPHFKEGRFLERILSQFKKLEHVKLFQLILALNFERVGTTIAKLIAKKYKGQHIDCTGLDSEIVERFSLDKEEIVQNIQYEKIQQIEYYVKQSGYSVSYPKESDDFTLKYELTGSPKSHGFKSKSEFKKRITDFNVQHTTLTNADYLITDDLNSTSSKVKKAKKQEKEIITYSNFIKLLNSKK